MTVAERELARAALQQWANVANVSFSEMVETSSNVGDFRFAYSSYVNDLHAGGYCAMPAFGVSASDVWIAPKLKLGGNFDYYVPFLLLHEIGHGLGLKHPFDDWNRTLPTLPAETDTTQFSVMSYTANPRYEFWKPDGNGSYVFAPVYPTTPMLYDMQAIHYLYGPNMGFHAAADVYSFGAIHTSLAETPKAGIAQ